MKRLYQKSEQNPKTSLWREESFSVSDAEPLSGNPGFHMIRRSALDMVSVVFFASSL